MGPYFVACLDYNLLSIPLGLYVPYARSTQECCENLRAYCGEVDCVRSVLCAFKTPLTGGPCNSCRMLGKEWLQQLKSMNERSNASVDMSAGGQASFAGRHPIMPQLGVQEIVARLNEARLGSVRFETSWEDSLKPWNCEWSAL